MDRRTSGDEMDADRDLGRTLSRFGSFMLGAVTGLLVSAAITIVVILASPPPADLPLSGRVEIIGQPQGVESEPFVGEPASDASDGATLASEPAGADSLAPEADEAGPGQSDAGQSDAGQADAGQAERSIIAVVPQGDGEPQAATSAPAEPGLPASALPQMEQAGAGAGPAGAEPAGTRTAETGTAAAAPAETMAAATATAAAPAGAAEAPQASAASGGQGASAPAAMAPDAGPTDSPELARTDAGQGAAPDPAGLPDGGAAALPGGDGTALADNASLFDAPRQSPLLAVVLVGDAVADLTADRLALLTMPLTVAVPPDRTGAAQLGAWARAAGHEVLADLSLATLPVAGGEHDLGEAAARRVASLDVAVGATATGGTADADLLAPVLAELDRQGLAWVDASDGIGTPAEDIAREIGMPYAQGSRIVPADADPDRIYREIDSTARLARQWGTAVLFLDAGEPALQALVRWGLEQQTANPIWFAPISAVIERRAAL